MRFPLWNRPTNITTSRPSQIFTAIEQAGIVPRLVDYTSTQAAEQPELQFYATTALAHFAPGPRIAHSMFVARLSLSLSLSLCA